MISIERDVACWSQANKPKTRLALSPAGEIYASFEEEGCKTLCEINTFGATESERPFGKVNWSEKDAWRP